MLQSVFRHSCLVFLGLCISVYGLYLPPVKSYTRPTYLRTHHNSYRSQYERPTDYRETPYKRADRFVTFSRFLARQSPRYRDDKIFVEKMFRLFDMNEDDVIERDEFRAILQLFGIVSHAF